MLWLVTLVAASLKDLANCDPLKKDMRIGPRAQTPPPKKNK
jgi:hypothetical protein